MIVAGGVVALPHDNIDTDQMFPGKYLTLISKQGFGKYLFEGTGYLKVLEAHRDAKILVAGDNIGCGSSREHAVWALADWGIRAVIAPSFARIFHENCYTNGVVPIVLEDRAAFEQCLNATQLEIDVDTQVVRKDGKELARFDLDPLRKEFILHGGFYDYLATKIDTVRTWVSSRA
ncbi:MAG: 3-isopropylmalate dehydratase small subunit [Vulcanimicrobiaceae bacterium]